MKHKPQKGALRVRLCVRETDRKREGEGATSFLLQSKKDLYKILLK